jgi:hypothetical protein
MRLPRDGRPILFQNRPTVPFHAWNNEAVAEKSAARKNSKAKKTDNVESFVYRTPEGEIAIPGTYLKGSLCDDEVDQCSTSANLQGW